MWRYAPKSLMNATNNQMDDFIGREMLYPNTGGRQGQYIPDLYTRGAINFAANNQPNSLNHQRPFFLLLDYATPRANTAEARRTGNGMQVPTDAPFSEETWPQPEKNRAAMIARLDNEIGELLGQLRKIHQESNTVIFFSSVSLPEKAGGVDPQFFHSMLSTNDLRLPMIVHWPGRIPAGQVSGFKCWPCDFLPTAAEMALTRSPANLPGRSILPVLTGQAQTNRAGMN
jgi:arylsulfatase A-like enzyme